MTATALFIIDPPEALDPPTDTTLALMRESLDRGWRVAYATLEDLQLSPRGPLAMARPVTFHPGRDLFAAGPPEELDPGQCDVVWFRKDPPVDLAFLHATYILDFLPPGVLQINPVAALRNFCEKLIPARFPELVPPTLTTRSPEALAAFARHHGRIVVKPLEDCSGHGVIALEGNAPDLSMTLERATGNRQRMVQGQAFLADIEKGDIRVLLLGGEIIGRVRRRPAPGDFRSNINAGGRCEPCDLTPADRELCARIGAWLRQQAIHFAGVDIVGGRVLEVNITSPSCLREINAIYDLRLECRILDYVENRLASGPERP